MDLLNEVPVTLVVKAPNQKVADQTVECALNWTVRKLKEHLSRVYPSNPTENQQRIIYSGKLLQDDVTLKDVLRQYGQDETVHTVHLVCSNFPADGFSSQSTSNTSSSPSLTTTTSTEGLRHRLVLSSTDSRPPQDISPQQPNQSTAANITSDRLQFSASAFHPSHYNPFMSPYLPPDASGTAMQATAYNNPYTMEQMMWLQQQAYVQYMTNYMQYFPQGMIPPHVYGQPTTPLLAPPNPANLNAVQDQQQANLNDLPGQQQPQQQAAQQPPIMRMNAQGGPVNDEDDFERDWLDWFYMGVRFALLLCILYFYSTPTRFFLTIAMMLFVYFFQVGWFRVIFQRRREAPPAANPPPAEEEPDGRTDEQPGEAGATEEARQPGGLALAWSVFVSFFSSLAPQPPPPINAN